MEKGTDLDSASQPENKTGHGRSISDPLGGNKAEEQREAMNVSCDRGPARFDLRSPSLVLIDPMALDGLGADLKRISQMSRDKQQAGIRALSTRGLRIGLTDVPAFHSGSYELDVQSFESADPDVPDPDIFEVDSGSVVVIDLTALKQVADAFTWGQYDAFLKSTPGDNSVIESLNRSVGGPRFAILLADGDSPFSGDGAFRLRVELLRRVVNA